MAKRAEGVYREELRNKVLKEVDFPSPHLGAHGCKYYVAGCSQRFDELSGLRSHENWCKFGAGHPSLRSMLPLPPATMALLPPLVGRSSTASLTCSRWRRVTTRVFWSTPLT